MRLQIRYFASIRESIGLTGEVLHVDMATVSDLRQHLTQRGGSYEESLNPGKALRCAVNQVMVTDSAVLMDGAEVAFFPPVTGG